MTVHQSIAKRLRLYIAMFLASLSATAAMAETLVISGSGNPEFVLGVLARAFNATQTEHQVIIPPSTGTAGGLSDVESGKTALGRIGRPLKSDELARGLVYVPLGRDPVTFVGGAAVTVKGLTQTQAVDIYSGKITNWQALGGKAMPIRPIGREATDTSRQSISRLIKPFESIVYGENVKVVHLDPQQIELLDRFPGALGFLNRSALAASKTKLVHLALDGVEPTPLNVGAGRYPLWVEFGLIHKSGSPRGAARAFIEFAQSPVGIGLLREQGVLAAAARP